MLNPTAASAAAIAPSATQSAIPSRRFLRKNSCRRLRASSGSTSYTGTFYLSRGQ